jgi:formate hydrogenlyase subunit 6/NADH:ubiquinone oxidoreductase subunit I
VSTVVPAFEATRCARYRYRYSECRRCRDACPHGAIMLDDAGAAVDSVQCRNCALCTTACPTGALVAGNLPRVELLKRATTAETRFSFACAPSGLSADAVVPCLGALDAAMLAYLGKRSISITLLGAAHCDRCEHGTAGASSLAAQVKARDALEDACDDEAWAGLTIAGSEAGDTDQAFRPGRRGLFRRLIGRGVAEAEKALAPEPLPVVDKAIRPGPWHVPEMRELLQIVCRRGSDQRSKIAALPELRVATMQLARGCTNCSACVRACPTGALQIRESEADAAFMFYVDRCVGCNVCAEVCQPRVLRAGDVVDATPGGAGTALNILAKQRCDRCDRYFASPEPEETCPVCRDDAAAFDLIFG